MAQVSKLNVDLQPGTANTFFASWEFDDTYRSTTSTNTKTVSSIAVGKYVKIKSGATWYNGTPIDSWVFNDIWQIYELIGDRAVLNRNQSGSHRIMSPINVRNLSGLTSTSTNTVVKYNTLDHYEIKWSYDPGNGMWFTGNSTTTKDKNATYSPPENATRIQVSVKPVSKTFKQNNNEVYYWTSTTKYKQYYMNSLPPKVPSTPTVEIDNYYLTASLENIDDARADKIEFQVVSVGGWVFKTEKVTIRNRAAYFQCYIETGNEYKVRCRAINMVGSTGEIYGKWSNYSSYVGTIPNVIYIRSYKATSETSVRLEWDNSITAKTYDIEYTTDKNNFDTNDDTTIKTGIIYNYREITGLESGTDYYFRVRAVNDQGASGWSTIRNVTLGKVPSAPTTWSSTSTAITNEQVTLYWIHNSQDNSSEKRAEIELTVNGVVKPIIPIWHDDESETTKFYVLQTYDYIEGTVIKWRVRTRGILSTYSDWSVQRVITVYAPPTLNFKILDNERNEITTVNFLPFIVQAEAGPSSQKPIGFNISIRSDDTYETTDNLGNKVTINKGDEIYTNYWTSSRMLSIYIMANNVILENGMNYIITCLVSMDSGLTVEDSIRFNVSWYDRLYEPDAEITIDQDVYAAHITPYCLYEDGSPVRDITLAVYRREFNGGFTEICSNISNTSNTTITDPHPSLDYARYRITATDYQTGAISFYDTPSYPVNSMYVIIQWDEAWFDFDARAEEDDDVMEEKPWTGSILKLPYNIDITESTSQDVDLVEYIGRSNPVSYYGTQLGTSGSWSMQIPKEDKDTLYALRRLSVWMGDVYIREPSGIGYWANVSVSMSQTHCEVTIPVTISVRRVEGGI